MLNIPYNKKVIDEQQVIKDYENGMSTCQLAKKYGYKTPKSINDLLKRNGVQPRKLIDAQHLRRGYSNLSLSVIDSEIKAYYIGLLLTDGYIMDNEEKHKHYIELTLEDEDVIMFLANHFNTNYYPVKKNQNVKTLYRFVLYGKELVNEIKRYGLTQAKTYTIGNLNLTEQEQKYIPYIIRGCIDGDGWVRKDGKEFYICSASKMFIEWIINSLNNINFKELETKVQHNKGYNDVYLVRTALKHNIDLLKTSIYDKPFGMNRKYNRVHQLA